MYICLRTRFSWNAYRFSRARRKHDDPEEVQRQVESTGCDSHKAEWRTKVPGTENRKAPTRQEPEERRKENEVSQVEGGKGRGVGTGPGWRVAAPGSRPLDSTSVGRWPVSDMLRGLSSLCIRVHRPSPAGAHATHVTPPECSRR